MCAVPFLFIMGREPELIPFKHIIVKFARKYILRRIYSHHLLTPKEVHKMVTILRRIDKAILHLNHLRSLVVKLIRRSDSKEFDDLL